MKYAIDRYIVGKEAEVSANEFDHQFIPMRRSRFTCPECGEPVFFRSRGGQKQSNEFYHQVKTDSSPECDKRVDGRSDLSLSQRVGLPLFLTRVTNGKFRLNMGFPPVGNETLSKNSDLKAKVVVKGDAKERTVPINHTYFLSDTITLIPIDFLPSNRRNYKITLINATKSLYREWSDYADGFDFDGAIFTYDETGGKKIRRNDSISTCKSYYFLTKNSLPAYPEIQSEAVGTILLSGVKYSIYKAQIFASIDNTDRFTLIDQDLKRRYGVRLLECIPEIIPLWPPTVIDYDRHIAVKESKQIECGVVSGNTIPQVFRYTYNTVSSFHSVNTGDGISVLHIPISSEPTVLSVDRKYVGREMVFQKRAIERFGAAFELSFVTSEKTVVPWEAITEQDLSSGFSLISNAKAILYLGSRNKSFQKITIAGEEVKIPKQNGLAELYLVIGNLPIVYTSACRKREEKTDSKELARQIRASRHGQLVPVPRWLDYYMRETRIRKQDELFSVLYASIVNGKIPLGVLIQLQRYITVRK